MGKAMASMGPDSISERAAADTPFKNVLRFIQSLLQKSMVMAFMPAHLAEKYGICIHGKGKMQGVCLMDEGK